MPKTFPKWTISHNTQDTLFEDLRNKGRCDLFRGNKDVTTFAEIQQLAQHTANFMGFRIKVSFLHKQGMVRYERVD